MRHWLNRMAGTALTLLVCFGVIYDARAQVGGDFEWLLQFGGVGGPHGSSDHAWDVHADGIGYAYVAGETDGTLPDQSSAGGPDGGPDAFLRKYDHYGNVLWTRQFGTPAVDAARSVVTRDSTVYVGGRTNGALPAQANAGGFDVFVRAYTAGGNELRTLQFGSELSDDSWGLSADTWGIYIAGFAGGALPGLESHGGGTDAFIGKLVPEGGEFEILVEIDIKPGEHPNSINLGSRGVVPVAILSSPAFDANTVDPATVTLAHAAVALRGRGTLMVSLEDVNGDGLLDLVVHIDTDALELTSGDVEAVLTGRTFAGAHIRGVDSIRVVP